MNGFHVHAIGWVLTANAFTLTAAEARELTELWTDVVRSRAEDLRQALIHYRALFDDLLETTKGAPRHEDIRIRRAS